jgi:hypothetical protein
MIGQFIAVLFLARELAHREHLRTKSYAHHMALGDFYKEVLKLADSLAEAYQGRKGIIEIPLLDNEFPGGAIDSMRAQLAWLETNRDGAVGKDERAMQNIVDEIVALYLATLYKLVNLK